MNIQFSNWQAIDINALNNAFISGTNEFTALLNSFDPNTIINPVATNTRLTGNSNGLAVDVRGNHFIDEASFQTVNYVSLIDATRNLLVTGSVTEDFNTGLFSGAFNRFSYTSTNSAGLSNLLDRKSVV